MIDFLVQLRAQLGPRLGAGLCSERVIRAGCHMIRAGELGAKVWNLTNEPHGDSSTSQEKSRYLSRKVKVRYLGGMGLDLLY